VLRRCRHVVSEDARTTRCAELLAKKNYEQAGELLVKSHNSLRDDYEVSCPELDLLVELAEKIGLAGGVIGSRMTGGGFGGCTVSLVETGKVDGVTRQLVERYRANTGIGASVLRSRPAQGAHVVKL
jgi:galactokinase